MKRTALAALLLLGACASTEPGSDGPSLGALAGSEWIMLNETRSPTPPTLGFAAEGDRAAGYAGCNRWTAAASANDQAIEFGNVGTTRMMCQGPSMEAERAFVTMLNDTRGFRIENSELVLYDIGGADLARFRRTN